MKISNLILVGLIATIFSSCGKENAPYISQPVKNPFLQITFIRNVDSQPLKLDTLIYRTTSGNQYLVTDCQYFISRIRLHEKGGKWVEASPGSNPHYVDARIPGTDQWNLEMTASAGECDSLSFVFGLDEADNISNRFPDPPERDMFWPEMLGGGYHCMKLNLKWKKTGGTVVAPFMFHLGTGQMYSGTTIDPDSIIGFIPNHFTVSLPFSFTFMKNGKNPALLLIMNIEKWFDGAFAFDFADYPRGIMQNQEGMFRGGQNGKRAFDIILMMED